MSQVRLICFSVLVIFSTSLFAARLAPIGKSVPNEVLIKVRAAASTNEIEGIGQLADADETQTLARFASGTLMRVHSRSKGTQALASALANGAQVEFVEPNYILKLDSDPNDPSYPLLWALENTGQVAAGQAGTAGADIDVEAAWNVTKGSRNVVVAVVDTGIDYTHPDLLANLWINPGGKGNAACASGTFGFNAITRTCDPRDDNGHGTHVAGTIGAIGDNGVGVTGVNWTTSIMALKFLNSSGYGTTADAITAIDFAIQAKNEGVNVRVLSNSWGGGAFSKALLDAINQANANDILFVAAAGNDGSGNDSYPHYPSSYTTPNMIAVAATDNRDQLAWFSNWGATTVHIAAPGVSVYSTVMGGSYANKSGTSMAAPHVAGVAALVLAAFPAWTTAQVKSAILNGVDPLPNLTSRCITGGRLNAAKAVGGTPTGDFWISISPAFRTVTQGGATTYAMTINPQNGFAGSVDLNVSGLPAGATASITPATTTTTTTLAVASSNTTPVAAASFAITGTSGAMTRTTYATLSVVAPQVPAVCPSFSLGYGPSLNSPAAVVIGDLNGDGKSDYAVADAGTNVVHVRYGRTFVSYTTLAVGKGPVFVIAADLNGDGKLDLATANSLSHDVSVLLANGSGGFIPAVHYATGTSPFAVAAGDFNRDGRLDLAVANNGSASVSILLGQSGGTFGAATQYTAGSSPFWVTAADVDADGRMDLAVANFSGGTVSLLRGNGDGTFSAASAIAVGTKPSSVTCADFDRDGRTDLAVSNYGSGNVSLLSGNGDGTFAPAVNIAVGMNPYSISAGDLNSDGALDFVTANSSSNDISIVLANGSGSFKPALSISVGYAPSQAAVGDFNDDGRPDVLIAAQSSQSVMYVTNTSGCVWNCGMLANALEASVGSQPDSVATGDLNGDGRIDLAIADSTSGNVAVRGGNGDGTFSAGAIASAGSAPHGVIAADFNRDGKLDLAVGSTGSNEVAILLGRGDGTLQGEVRYAAGTGPRALAARDFNRDGKLDLAVAARDAGAVTILSGGGDGTFQSPVSYGAGTNPEAVAIADFNRDGIADLAVANAGSANVSILLGNADGTFQPAINSGAGTTPRALVAGDLNGDGKADIAVANAGSNDLSLLAGNGNGTFKTAVNYATGSGPSTLIAIDLNSDGLLDLITGNSTSHDVSVLFGTDTGSWGTATSRPTGLGPAAIAGADFNRDGKTDVVSVNSTAASFSLLLNTCPMPDLTITKTHSGTFGQGATGDYTIAVSNAGLTATNAVVVVKDTLPQGLAANAMSGTGWTCVLANATCTRSDALVAGASYPPITLTVNISANTPLSVTNNATVSGGGELNTANSTAADVTTITAQTEILLLNTHAGTFAQGATGRTYSLVVRNAGSLSSSGAIAVSDTLPAGLTAVAMSGPGWSCSLGSLTCVRTDALAGSSSYPTIVLTVNVASNAPALVTNTATVTGGGDVSAANNTASDPTQIWSANPCVAFGAPAYYSMNTWSSAMVVADLNHDGRPDVVTAGSYSSGVVVRLGAGDGTLLPSITYTARSPGNVVAGDLDHDGDLDLVTISNEYDARLSVLAGNGDGSFAAPIEYDVLDAAYLSNVKMVDLDRDGNLDIITSSSYSRSEFAYVFLGNDDGTLRAPSAISLGNEIRAWMTADIDGDSIVDLIAVTSSPTSYDLWALRGNGDGTFKPAVKSPMSYSMNSLTTGDFNDDGNTDVAAAAYDFVLIFLGNGDGTFRAGTSFDAGWSSNSIIATDLNADGRLDLIVGGSSMSILTGNGDGTFQKPVRLSVDSIVVAVNDFNADGRPDLAYGNYGVSIRLGGCPDLTIKKTHSGTFRGGAAGSYAIDVTNVGTGAFVGTMTVVDTLPPGLTVSYLPYNWSCTQSGQELTCKYTGTLEVNASTRIDLGVYVSPTAATTITNVATVSAPGETNLANNTASDTATVTHAPDLVIRMSHSGTWAAGQTGSYTITVGNIGTASTTGSVTVTDSPPFGMALVSMSGVGWSCNGLSCTRSDALAPTAIYPPITLTVSVLAGATSAYNNAFVSGGGESEVYNSSTSDYTVIMVPPVAVVATASSATLITVTWYSYTGLVFEVFRRTAAAPYTSVGSTVGNTFFDSSVAANTVYLYKVRAIDGSVAGPFSTPDFASTVTFTDDPIVAGSTVVKAIHFQQLRDAVNQARATAGLTATAFTDPSLAGLPIRKIHLTQLQYAINEARQSVGLLVLTFTDNVSVKAVDINSLRGALK